MNTLQGKHAVVTGGSRGIGAAVATALIRAGANVTIMGRTPVTLEDTAKQIGANRVIVDISDESSVERAFLTAQELAPIDILVNNAGNAETAPFTRTDHALWQRMLNINLTGTYLCSKAVVPGMIERGYGRIINIASTAGLTGYAYVTAYCAAKHGVIGLTRALAIELATKGITVNAICPGYTNTDMVTNAVANIVSKTGRTEDEALAQLVKNNPQQRLIEPEEVANTVMWLCNEESKSVTGQAIAIAGGEIL